jgi:hypothetical protein
MKRSRYIAKSFTTGSQETPASNAPYSLRLTHISIFTRIWKSTPAVVETVYEWTLGGYPLRQFAVCCSQDRFCNTPIEFQEDLAATEQNRNEGRGYKPGWVSVYWIHSLTLLTFMQILCLSLSFCTGGFFLSFSDRKKVIGVTLDVDTKGRQLKKSSDHIRTLEDGLIARIGDLVPW